MRVRVKHMGMYTYPDVIAVCGEPNFIDNQFDTLTNPTVVVEVISPSTEAYDRGAKFAHYRRLDSLQEYLLVAQNEPRIDHYTRRGVEWVLMEATDLEGTVELTSVGCRLLLREVYDKVEFKPVSEQGPQENKVTEVG